MAKWDGRIRNMTISEGGHPELYAELSRLHPKERSDRLRSLAFLGLHVLTNGTRSGAGEAVAAGGAEQAAGRGAEQHAARSNLKKKLLSSV